MFDNKLTAPLLAVLLVVGTVGPVAMAAGSQQRAYAGTHVSFDTTSNAVVDYTVDDETMFESVRVQSQSEARSQGNIDGSANLSAVTGFLGAGLSMQSEAGTGATVTAESGATMRAHDSPKGILVVGAGEESQYVGVNLSSDAEAESESEDRVVVTTDDGQKGTFIVVGNGSVAVNGDDNVTAELGSDSTLVFRAYGQERTEDDEQTEEMIANGTAAAEVYVRESADASGEFVAGVANYSQDTAVEVTQKSEGEIEMTAERTESEGRVVITSVSEAVIDSTEDLDVMVDGEAAAEASSYSELRSAADGGSTSKFLVRQSASAEAAADVLVALNHFSERDITMRSEGSAEAKTYAGAHTSFNASGNVIADYAVNGETMFESARVQSQNQAHSQGSVDAEAELSAVTAFSGADLSMQGESETSMTASTESGATMRAHDSPKGILVVGAGEESQYVGVNLSSDAEAESESEDRVVVTTDDGQKGTFIVVGEGAVAVNDEGNVTAELGSDSTLVFRAYGQERTEDDEQTEEMIANGTAAAEVYVRESADASGEFVAGVANYSQDTAVEITHKSEGEVRMTAERTESEGRVVITSVSEAVIDSTEDLSVMVDGEAAAEVSSYSELQSATEGGDSSKFLVQQSSSAEASADVLVGLNHFSERNVTMSDDGGSGTDGTDGSDSDAPDGDDSDGTDTSTPGQPGLGVGIALVALLAAALVAIRSR